MIGCWKGFVRMSLKIKLKEWTDCDYAMHALAQSMGVMDETVPLIGDAKHVFWSDNPVGNMLGKTLDELVEIGFLEKRDESDGDGLQYRYNSAFIGSWE